MLQTLSLLLLVSQVELPNAKQGEGDEMIYKYLCAETDKLSQKFLDGAKTIGQWKEKRPRLHREYMDMLGLWPIPEKTPLQATVTRTFERHGVVIENLHFQSKPGLYVTANLYRPKSHGQQSVGVKKLPAIVYVCGHAGKGRDGNKSAYQDHGLWFANNGYVCIVLDTLQLGEILGIHHGTYGLRGGKDEAPTRMWWHSAGYTPAGVECWNGIRAIDYLLTRPEVDPDRIGVTGISGGGTVTFWIAAADDRVKVAVPVSGMSDLESYVKNKVINGHCDCMFLHNAYQWEWTTIAALIAPRPMLFANSDNDPIFPMDGNRRIIERLRKIYAMYDKPVLVDEYVSVGGHAYRPDLRVAIFQFLNKHLKGDTTSKVEDTQFEPIPGKELRVFPTDDDVPKYVLNGKIDETFVPRAKVELPEKGKFGEWKAERLAELKQRVFFSHSKEFAAARFAKVKQVYNEATYYVDLAITEPGIAVGAFKVSKGTDSNLLAVIEEEYLRTKEREDMKQYFTKGSYWFLLPRGMQYSKWTDKSPPNYVERAHVLLGHTVDGARIRDVIATAKFMEQQSKMKPRVLGVGTAGVLIAYAELIQPTFQELIVIDPPTTHKDGPHFLNVLRVLDIPEALGLLAPTPLTIVGGKDRAFDRTEAIYRLAGAIDKLKRQ